MPIPTKGMLERKLAIDLFCYRLGRAILGLASSLTSIEALISEIVPSGKLRKSGLACLSLDGELDR